MKHHNAPFSFKSAYMDETDFIENSSGLRVRLHRGMSDYHRSVIDPDYLATREALTGCVTVCGERIDAAFLNTFNEWRIAKHEADIAEMKARPDTFGPADEIDSTFPTPRPARGAFWADDQLHFVEPTSHERSAA